MAARCLPCDGHSMSIYQRSGYVDDVDCGVRWIAELFEDLWNGHPFSIQNISSWDLQHDGTDLDEIVSDVLWTRVIDAIPKKKRNLKATKR